MHKETFQKLREDISARVVVTNPGRHCGLLYLAVLNTCGRHMIVQMTGTGRLRLSRLQHTTALVNEQGKRVFVLDTRILLTANSNISFSRELVFRVVYVFFMV